MSGERRLLLRTVKPLFKEARSAIGQVAIAAHQDHASLLRGRDGESIEISDVPGMNLIENRITLIDFGVGGPIISPSVNWSPGFSLSANIPDSRFVAASFCNSDGGPQYSANVRANGLVEYDGRRYLAEDTKWPPVEFLGGNRKSDRITAITIDAQSGLLVARLVEESAALLAGREPQTGRLDQARADLAGYVGEVPLAENVAALLPRAAE